MIRMIIASIAGEIAIVKKCVAATVKRAKLLVEERGKVIEKAINCI